MSDDNTVHEPEWVNDAPSPGQGEADGDTDRDFAEEEDAARRVVFPSGSETVSLVDALQGVEHAETILVRREQLLRMLRMSAVRSTEPEHWVMFRAKDGTVSCMPSAAACHRIGEVYGIELFDMQPVVDGRFVPDRREVDGKPNTIELTGWAKARSRVTHGSTELFQFTRRSDEKFLGRDGYRGDHESCVITGLRSKGARIISALGRVPPSYLDAIWANQPEDGKTTERCTKGSGYGTSSQRQAERDAPEDVKARAQALWKELRTRVGGNNEAARQLLQEITYAPAKGDRKEFKGRKDPRTFTEMWQVEKAEANLAKHATFGDDRKES